MAECPAKNWSRLDYRLSGVWALPNRSGSRGFQPSSARGACATAGGDKALPAGSVERNIPAQPPPVLWAPVCGERFPVDRTA